ncbi:MULTISPECIES: TadE/TadG family type IV pilus assembly protein [Variovorax]|uniref:TadE/TadG family type IV pilus assembly protein n=1 Tax=Variovorax TaxID=34072 RepID=UPI000364829C|nr:TadE/TadG family type IV pilus assembly protein [Variovorax paradoxus]
MRSGFPQPKRVTPRPQRGVAAIEFALVFSVLFLGIYGFVTFSAVLYVQQAVSRAAEDGARAAQLAGGTISAADLQANARTAIYRSLALSLITPAAAGGTPSSKEDWLRLEMKTLPVINLLPDEIEVKVTYPYRANPLFPPLVLTSNLIPEQLTGKATATR